MTGRGAGLVSFTVMMRDLGVEALPAVLLCPASRCDVAAPRLVGYARPEQMLAFLRSSGRELPGPHEE